MLWSVLLYVVLMLAFNWDDVSNKVRGNNSITIISNLSSPQAPGINNPSVIQPNIADNVSLIRKIITIAKNVHDIIGIPIR